MWALIEAVNDKSFFLAMLFAKKNTERVQVGVWGLHRTNFGTSVRRSSGRRSGGRLLAMT